MPIDFPNTPSNGESFTVGDKTWTYNGSVWILTIGSAAIANASIDIDKLNAQDATPGYFLRVNTSANSGIKWEAVSSISSLDDVGDVTISNAAAGQVLKYDGNVWINDSDSVGTTINELNDIGDVTITGDATGQFLKYDGNLWINESIISGATISDTAPESPASGQVWYNSENGATYIYYDSFWVEIGGVSTNIVLNTIDAKGDIIVGTADNEISKLSAGTNGYVLSTNSATATGLEWKQVSSDPMTSQAAAIIIMDIGV